MCVVQVLETIGRMKEAVEAYKDRVALGGWTEEAFEAQMRVVSLVQCLGRSPIGRRMSASGHTRRLCVSKLREVPPSDKSTM